MKTPIENTVQLKRQSENLQHLINEWDIQQKDFVVFTNSPFKPADISNFVNGKRPLSFNDALLMSQKVFGYNICPLYLMGEIVHVTLCGNDFACSRFCNNDTTCLYQTLNSLEIETINKIEYAKIICNALNALLKPKGMSIKPPKDLDDFIKKFSNISFNKRSLDLDMRPAILSLKLQTRNFEIIKSRKIVSSGNIDWLINIYEQITENALTKLIKPNDLV